ncbi:MAG TPA: EF-hand domain-containing protein [Planctomycetota bacterium]|nr:EF-hand domain-containing protein [Planctomycetota bacterium]
MPRVLSFLMLAAFTLCIWGEESDSEPIKSADQTVLTALPKVPTLATIVGDGNPKTQPDKWIADLIKKKEIKARVEIVMIKQKFLAEQDAKDAEERERIRRRQMYDKALGTLFDTTPVQGEAKKKTMTMKLDFQVTEMEVYRRLIDALKIRGALASDVVETLTRLDRDNDGKLTGEEYRDAACIFNATQRLFSAVDNDGDGYLTVAEIEAAKTLPANGAAALAEGIKNAANSDTFMIKGFDANKDGVLSIEERKALSSAYLEISLKAAQEVAAYQKLLDDLSTARQAAAAKFENLTIELSEGK